MKDSVDLTNFTAGELSPRMKSRTDVSKYYNSCETMLNMVVMPQGGATRRPGTMSVASAISSSFRSRLIEFIFSTLQPYVIEFGNLLARVYANDGQVQSGGSPVQVVTPYLSTDTPQLEYVQSDDELFLCHPSYPTQTLDRSSNTAWTLVPYAFRDGPYQSINTTATTLSLSGNTGTVTVTASSVTGINNGAGFQATDVGRHLRIKLQSLWGWLTIASVTNVNVVQATVQPANPNGAFGLDGAPWLASTGYPAGAIALNGDNYYRCVVAGLSASSGGPTGTGTNIADGSAVWNFSAAGAGVVVAPYAQGSPPLGLYNYGVGALVSRSGIDYVCTQAGLTTGAPGVSGTGTGIVDQGVVWSSLSGTIPTLSTLDWQLGKWCGTTGYPWLPTFWQQRLALCGTNNQPNALELSVVGDFPNFAPSQSDGSVTDVNALSWVIDDDGVNGVRWLSPAGSAQAMQLGIGTVAGEQIMQAATTAQALTPASVQAYRETALGSAPNVRPLRILKSVLFFNRPGRKLHEWTFQWQVNGYLGPDLSVLAEHITQTGVAQMAYQQSPYGVIWMIRGDGTLIGLTYLREQEIVAWHRHQLGGQYYGGPPIVESLTVIPSPDQSYDEVWLAVLRTVNGVPWRSIEVMSKFYANQPAEQAWFLDAAVSNVLAAPAADVTPSGYTNSATLTGVAPAWTGTGTLIADAAVFSSASVGQVVRLNGGSLNVTAYIGPRQVTAQVLLPLTSQAPALTGSWTMMPLVTVFSGVAALNGETVAVLGDGQDFGTQTATAGNVTLPVPGASTVIAGLPSTPVIVTMPASPQRAAQAGVAGRVKRIDHLFIRLLETIGGQVGTRTTDPMTSAMTDNLETIPSRSAADAMNQAAPLFTGIRKLDARGPHDREQQMILTQPSPLPFTVLGISASVDLEEMAQP